MCTLTHIRLYVYDKATGQYADKTTQLRLNYGVVYCPFSNATDLQTLFKIEAVAPGTINLVVGAQGGNVNRKIVIN